MSPGRRTNRKNLRSCQRTILLYSFCFWSQRKILVCKYVCFQPSARRPQARDRKWCSLGINFREKPHPTRVFAGLIGRKECRNNARLCTVTVKIAQISRRAQEEHSWRYWHRGLTPIVYPLFIVGGHEDADRVRCVLMTRTRLLVVPIRPGKSLRLGRGEPALPPKSAPSRLVLSRSRLFRPPAACPLRPCRRVRRNSSPPLYPSRRW